VTRHAIDLSDPALLAFWRARHLCTVTTVRPDGGLHVTPMGIVLDADRGLAWGITSGGSRKARNLRAGGQAGGGQIGVCQVDGRWWSSLAGTADVLDDPEVVREAEQRYAERYRTPRVNPERVAVRITVERVLANLPRPE
jgi:F420H(2)-dependent biliverdin reductase